MKSSLKLLCVLLLCTAGPVTAQEVPEYINYQGLLKGPDGRPLATGNYTLEFNVYDQANAGVKVWGPFLFDGNTGGDGHGLIVPVVNGSFNVIIGPKDTSGVSIRNAFSGPNRFIEIRVNGGSPILPRQQFLSTAYALQSQRAQVADVAAVAQGLVQQLAEALCPPGSIMAFAGPTNHIPDGWLLCDGRSLPTSDTNYARLYAAIGTAWGAGGTTNFNLPDLRGMFLRGVTGARTDAWADPQFTNRVAQAAGGSQGNSVGSVQVAEFKQHNHNNGSYNLLLVNNRAGIARYVMDGQSAPNAWDPSGSILPAGGAETRPNNAYVNFIIKY